MRLPALALVFIVLAAATTGVAGPPPVVAPVPTSPPAAGGAARTRHISDKRVFDVTDQAVTWSYAKLNHPQLVVDVLRDVAAGKASRTAVAGLASKAATDKLLKITWPQRSAAPLRGVTRGVAPKGETKPQFAQQRPSEWGSLTPTIAGVPEYTPTQLKMADAYDKEVKRGIVWFTATADGHVVATIPTGAPFRVAEIISYDGTLEMVNGHPILKPWDWRKTAPFELSVRAGQEFAVIVEFAPQFDLSTMTAGAKTGRLELQDDKFTVKIPISGMFQGIHVAGVVLTADDQFTAVVLSLPGKNQRVSTKVQILNLGDARTATISADSLPAGVTLDGSPSVSLGPGEAKQVDVGFLLNACDYGYAQPILLRATAPGGLTSAASIVMNVVPSDHEWAWQDEVNGVFMANVYWLSSDGHWVFNGMEENKSSLLGWNITMSFELGGSFMHAPFFGAPGNLTGIGGPPLVSQTVGWNDQGPGLPYGTGWTTDYFADLIRRKGKFIIQMESMP